MAPLEWPCGSLRLLLLGLSKPSYLAGSLRQPLGHSKDKKVWHKKLPLCDWIFPLERSCSAALAIWIEQPHHSAPGTGCLHILKRFFLEWSLTGGWRVLLVLMAAWPGPENTTACFQRSWYDSSALLPAGLLFLSLVFKTIVKLFYGGDCKSMQCHKRGEVTQKNQNFKQLNSLLYLWYRDFEILNNYEIMN